LTNINIEIPDDIYRKVKIAAVSSDKTVKDYVIQKLDVGLKSRGFNRTPESDMKSRRRKR
jgi:hypothetical protein